VKLSSLRARAWKAGAVAAAGGAVFVAVGVASPPGGPDVSDVPAANGRGRLRRARPRRLRGHPGRLRRQPVDRRGHRRRRQVGHDGQAAQQLRLNPDGGEGFVPGGRCL